MTSGILVHDRRVFRFGGGSVAAGYKPHGRFTFGRPTVRPVKLELPGGTFATVGAFNPAPATLASAIRSDQVAVYTHASQTIRVPAGAIGVALSSDALTTELRGRQDGYKNVSGANRAESVVAFRITEPTAPRHAVSMPIATPSTCATNVCQPTESVVVPTGGVVVLARTGTASTVAADGLRALAASGIPAVGTAVDDVGWSSVTDVTGGKPMLVNAGRAVSTRPASIDPWQWDCGGGCWRPALVRSGSSAWMILIGGKGGSGLTMPKFADVLADMGAHRRHGLRQQQLRRAVAARPPADHRLRLRAAAADRDVALIPRLSRDRRRRAGTRRRSSSAAAAADRTRRPERHGRSSPIARAPVEPGDRGAVDGPTPGPA